MPLCCVVGCSNRKGKDKHVTYYRFPAQRKHEDPKTIQLVQKRRRLWKAAVNRNLSEAQWERSVTCSRHFVNGNHLQDIFKVCLPKIS